MAVLTAQGISRVAIELLTRTVVLPNTATRIPGEEFRGSNGDTITVRVPQPGTARTQGTPGATITYDDVTEIPVNVTLAHLYHAKLISDEEASLQLEDFARQVTRVQVSAVATGAEDEMAAAMNGLTEDTTIAFAASASADDTKGVILAARQALSEADCPADDRWFAVSPDIATRVLSVPEFTKVNESGSESALRRAVIGTLFGFTFVESNGLTAGTAHAYHRSGIAFANRVPVNPRGATSSAAATSGGIGMRQIFQYVPDKLSDASVLSTFAGAAVVLDDDSPETHPRIIKIGTAS